VIYKLTLTNEAGEILDYWMPTYDNSEATEEDGNVHFDLEEDDDALQLIDEIKMAIGMAEQYDREAEEEKKGEKMTQPHGPQPKARITKINGKRVPYPDEIELTEDQALELGTRKGGRMSQQMTEVFAFNLIIQDVQDSIKNQDSLADEQNLREALRILEAHLAEYFNQKGAKK